MANPPVLDDLQAAVTRITSVAQAATAALNGVAARIQAAVDQALANGATAAQLAPIQDEVTALNGASDALGVAVAAGTSAATPAPPATPPATGQV